MDLTEWIRRNPAALVDTRCWIAREIAVGMSFLHESGYIHCDLKPGNVLMGSVVGANGRAEAPKITDFGFVERVDPAGGPDCAFAYSAWSCIAISLYLLDLGAPMCHFDCAEF